LQGSGKPDTAYKLNESLETNRGIWKEFKHVPTYDITISNNFDFENSTAVREAIKFGIDTLKQSEHLAWLSC
jgi:hypothetical protein